jgi:hypothetical protein
MISTKEDFPRMSGNLFFKTVIEEYYNEKDPNGKEQWNKLKSRFLNFFEENNINIPEDLTYKTSQLLISKMFSLNYFSVSPWVNPPWPARENVFYIQSSDVIYNKNKILSLMSQITNCEMPTNIVEYYDEYLLAQEELVKTKMPWVKV